MNVRLSYAVIVLARLATSLLYLVCVVGPVVGQDGNSGEPLTAKPGLHHWIFHPDQINDGKLVPATGDIEVDWDDSWTIQPQPPHGWVLDGQTDFRFPDQPKAKLLPRTNLTVATWVRPDRFSDWTGVISAIRDNGSDESGWMLGFENQRPCIALATADGAGGDTVKLNYLTSSKFVSPGAWTFFAATYDGKDLRLFVDGEPVAQSPDVAGPIVYPNDVVLALGAYVDSNEWHPVTGRLGEIWLTGEAVDSAAIKAWYEDSRPHYPEGSTVNRNGLDDFPIRRTSDRQVGNTSTTLVPTSQTISPAGITLAYAGRPVDLALSPDRQTVAAKDNAGVVLIDVKSWQATGRLTYPSGGGSMHGIIFDDDGDRFWVSTAGDVVYEATRRDGIFDWSGEINLASTGEGAAVPCGMAFDSRRETLFIAMSRHNAVAEVDLTDGSVRRTIDVSVAPMDVLVLDDKLVVSNWGGRHPDPDEPSADSAGTPVLIDERGIAKSGTVGFVDLESGKQIREVTTGLHPSDLCYDASTRTVIVANANSDTISVIDPVSMTVISETLVRPDPKLPFGSATNALAISPDGKTLFAANGGNNAVAVLKRDPQKTAWTIAGFIPTAWYPGGIVCDDTMLAVANVKGFGSRTIEPVEKYNSHLKLGAVSRVDRPFDDRLAEWTQKVEQLALVPQILREQERADQAASQPAAPPRAVPEVVGAPSPIKHIIYIIKENRTYDQVFGDLPQGEGEPKLCDYPREITPNHHALAEEFVLLDNFYCNGVLSADGHSWATEGNVTDHLEKSFGGFARSYTFGDDPLTYSSSGFIWDHVLLHGLSFRNYGELDYATPIPEDATFKQIYDDFQSGTNQIKFDQNIGIDALARYSCREFPGWNMRIPDVLRASAFIKELKQAEEKGRWVNFAMVFLPQDHTSGLSEGSPTPAAHMADNDLALGQIVDAVSHSKFWKDTCIFVIEDDPQNGYDHVDGHRSIALVVGPHVRRGKVVSDFYNQTSVLHTMQRILGLPPMNQFVAMSPLMSACFTDEPDLTPYQVRNNNVPLDQLVGSPDDADPRMRQWFVATEAQDLEGLDKADENTMNQILWHAAHGPDAPYPAEWAGDHGRGLKERGLVEFEYEDDDDDD